MIKKLFSEAPIYSPSIRQSAPPTGSAAAAIKAQGGVCPPQRGPFTPEMLKKLEDSLNQFWKHLGVEVDLGNPHTHFFQRINDARNGQQISYCEIQKLFIEVFRAFGRKIATQKPDFQAVLTDISTKINVPFMLKWDNRNQQLELVAKTIMRNSDFRTPNPKFQVQHVNHEFEAMLAEDIADIARPATVGANGLPALDDVDSAIFDLRKRDSVDKLNQYLAALFATPAINPYYTISRLKTKLAIFGLAFDDVLFLGDSGTEERNLTQFGGRFGMGLDTDGEVVSDDGISHKIPGGLKIVFTYLKTKGLYNVDAQIVQGDSVTEPIAEDQE